LFEYIDSNEKIYKKIKIDLVKTAFNKIHKNLQKGIIPVGERDSVAYFLDELDKYCLKKTSKCIVLDRTILDGIKSDLETISVKEIFKRLNKEINDESEKKERKKLFAQTVFKIITDFSLQTIGKNEEAEKMSILPITSSKNNLQTIELPGDEVEAFAGFASIESRKYSFLYGKYSALISLKEREEGYRALNEIPIVYSKELNGIESCFIESLKEQRFYKPEYKYANDLISNLYHPVLKRLRNLFFPKKGMQRFFATKVPTLLTGTLGVLNFLKLSSLRSVTSLGEKLVFEESNNINYKELLPITISILSNKKLHKKHLITRNDLKRKIVIFYKNTTQKEHVKMVVNEIVIGDSIQYQYLFQLYYLDYFEDIEKSIHANESLGLHKIGNPELTGRIGLTHISKILNPSIDSNIDLVKYRKEVEYESKKIELNELKMKGVDIGDIIEDINNLNYTLYYSLKYSNYHVNPMLEYNLNDENPTWYFKENTKAFYKTL